MTTMSSANVVIWIEQSSYVNMHKFYFYNEILLENRLWRDARSHFSVRIHNFICGGLIMVYISLYYVALALGKYNQPLILLNLMFFPLSSQK